AERDFDLGELPAGTLVADPDPLAQALRNLLANAIHHTPPDHWLLRLRVVPPAGSPSFSIDADCPPLPPPHPHRVFPPYHAPRSRAPARGGGSGAGPGVGAGRRGPPGGVVAGLAAARGGAAFRAAPAGFGARRHTRAGDRARPRRLADDLGLAARRRARAPA